MIGSISVHALFPLKEKPITDEEQKKLIEERTEAMEKFGTMNSQFLVHMSEKQQVQLKQLEAYNLWKKTKLLQPKDQIIQVRKAVTDKYQRTLFQCRATNTINIFIWSTGLFFSFIQAIFILKFQLMFNSFNLNFLMRQLLKKKEKSWKEIFSSFFSGMNRKNKF